MSHQRVQKNQPGDKYTKESDGIALFVLQVGSISQNLQLTICEKVNKYLKS